ncbi:hypothetical protein CEQ90_00915 [Lewinellaceae bacterium SD302]|nr:hypothetical protein CEQ90_00915 [Lewinellaceae bacterium SD302]
MHDIEPHFQWRDKYRSDQDSRNPFYGRVYSEFGYENKVYNYLLHPQWDAFGSETLYLKVIFVDYDTRYTIIQFIGEWNDALHNDIMHLKREVIDELLAAGIRYFILDAENVLNFHADEDDYYEEWYNDVADAEGWVIVLNTLEHVADEMRQSRLDNYLHFGGLFNSINWRPQKPERVFAAMEGLLAAETKRVD